MLEFMKDNRLKFVRYQQEFALTFNRPLQEFWDNMFGFDIIKFDEQFIKSPDGTSLSDAVIQQYGQAANDLIKKLI